MQLLGSLVFTAFFLLWTFFYGIFFSIACLLLPFRGRFELARVWARVIMLVLRWTCRLDYRVEGRERLPHGNHIALDKTFLQLGDGGTGTAAAAAGLGAQARADLDPVRRLGNHASCARLRSIAAAARPRCASVLEQGKARLAEGEWVVIFPEGTRMPPGETRKYGVSGALLAAETGRLIVPIAHDAGYYWPRRGLMKKPGTIRVVIGPPIAAAGRNPREVNAEAQAWIEAHSRR